MRSIGHEACFGGMRNAYNILVGKYEGKRARGRPRRGWKDAIRMNLREIGWECVDWIHWFRTGDRRRIPVNTVINVRVP
jgi:hypothetical protein